MGYHIHHAIVVTSWDDKYLNVAHARAKEMFKHLVSNITGPGTNGFISFLIAPDGSKEGWDTSNEHDDQREEFCDWLDSEEELGVDYFEAAFGGDEPEFNTRLLRYNRK